MRFDFVLFWFLNSSLSFCLCVPEFEHLFCYCKYISKVDCLCYSKLLSVCKYISRECHSRESFSGTQITVSISNSWPWCICALCVMKVGAGAVEIFPNYSSLIDLLALLWAERHLHTSLKLGAPKTVMNERDMIFPMGFSSTEFFSAKNCWKPYCLHTSYTHLLIYFFGLWIPQHFSNCQFFFLKPNCLAMLPKGYIIFKWTKMNFEHSN